MYASHPGRITFSPRTSSSPTEVAVVFIRAHEIDEVLNAAEIIVAREAAMAKALLDGREPAAVMAGNYENMLKASGS